MYQPFCVPITLQLLWKTKYIQFAATMKRTANLLFPSFICEVLPSPAAACDAFLLDYHIRHEEDPLGFLLPSCINSGRRCEQQQGPTQTTDELRLVERLALSVFDNQMPRPSFYL